MAQKAGARKGGAGDYGPAKGGAPAGRDVAREDAAKETAEWEEAVQDAPPGCRLLLDVTPGARDPAFPSGFDPWRGRIGIRVRALAEGGKANKEVIALVAGFFGAGPGEVRIETGAADPRKGVWVACPRDAVLNALNQALGGP